MDVKIFKTQFDAIFMTSFNDFVAQAKNRTNDPYILSSISHTSSIASTGKRIRPYNVAVAYEAYSGSSWKDISHLLVGVELIHLMALIHDDIMDNAETRHGVQTVHSFTKNHIESLCSDSFVDHVSRSQAILVGDMIFSWAYKSISQKSTPKEVWDIVHELVEEVVVGQMIDVITPLSNNSDFKSVENKMLLKTARYTFSRPLMLGAMAASAPDKSFWLQKFGDALGLMFQAQDDLLDVVSQESLLKKSTLGDIKNGVHTLISVYVSDNANDEQKDIWNSWFGKNIDLDSELVNKFLTDMGAIDYVQDYISTQKEKAMTILAESDISESQKDNFKKIIDMLSHRKY
jgi:geranylgeranyl diphosphate synthase type I